MTRQPPALPATLFNLGAPGRINRRQTLTLCPPARLYLRPPALLPPSLPPHAMCFPYLPLPFSLTLLYAPSLLSAPLSSQLLTFAPVFPSPLPLRRPGHCAVHQPAIRSLSRRLQRGSRAAAGSRPVTGRGGRNAPWQRATAGRCRLRKDAPSSHSGCGPAAARKDASSSHSGCGPGPLPLGAQPRLRRRVQTAAGRRRSDGKASARR